MSNKGPDCVEQIIARTCHLCGVRHEGKTEDLPEGWQMLKGFRVQNISGKEEQMHFVVNVCAACADYQGRDGVLAIIKRWITRDASVRADRKGHERHG